jgi:hypothetical protein
VSRRAKFTHRSGRDHRLCLRPGCGLARKAGLPVCGPDWRKVPSDLKARLNEARGTGIDGFDNDEVGRENEGMEYLSAMHAIVEWFEQAG